MLLACARDVADRMELFTVPMPDDYAYIDVAIAQENRSAIPPAPFVPQSQKPKQKDLDEYMFRIGYSTGELRGWQATSMFRQANPGYSMLLGNMARCSRTFWSRGGDTESSEMHA